MATNNALTDLTRMMNTTELLARLKDAGVRNIDIARALDLPDSRVPEIYSGKRALKLDEAVKLVDAFKLEPEPGGLNPVTTPIARLLVQHVALKAGAHLDPDSDLVSELAEDLRAFSALVSDRRARDSVQTVDGFLRGLRTHRGLAGQPVRRLPRVS